MIYAGPSRPLAQGTIPVLTTVSAVEGLYSLERLNRSRSSFEVKNGKITYHNESAKKQPKHNFVIQPDLGGRSIGVF